MNPYPYQREGIDFLAARRTALLADEMGLGKSAQVVWAANRIGAERVLVLCPALARQVWLYEWRANGALGLPVSAIYTGKDVPLMEGVTVCSYSLATKGAASETIHKMRWDLVVLDEAHFLKSQNSSRNQAVYRQIVPNAEKVWALTGTPAPNHPGEMHPMMLHLFPESMEGFRDRSLWAFERRYCKGYNNGFTFKITGGKNLADLRRRLAPHILRRRKTEVLKDLPPIEFHHLPLDPGEIDYRAVFEPAQYGNTDMVQRRIAEESDLISRMLFNAREKNEVLPALAALANNANVMRRWIGMAKVDPVAEWIEARVKGNDDKVVLFGWHRDTLFRYKEVLTQKKLKPVLLFGGTSQAKRTSGMRKFQRDPKCRVFIGQIQTAGTAITLTNAHTVVFGEMDWVPGNNAQAAMRCHRIGQTNPVSVYVASLAGTVDEKLNRILREKAKTLTQLFD